MNPDVLKAFERMEAFWTRDTARPLCSLHAFSTDESFVQVLLVWILI